MVSTAMSLGFVLDLYVVEGVGGVSILRSSILGI